MFLISLCGLRSTFLLNCFFNVLGFSNTKIEFTVNISSFDRNIFLCVCVLRINKSYAIWLISNQIKSLVLSHHHSTSALVSEILMSVLQTLQKKKQFTYGQYAFTDCTEDNVQNTHTYTQYTQCTIKTYLVIDTHYTLYVHIYIMSTSIHSIM